MTEKVKSQLQSKLLNLTNGKKAITKLLSKYENNDIVKDEIIYDLVSFHPTKNIKKENLEYLVMKTRPPFNNLSLHYKYKNQNQDIDLSYMLCLKNVFEKYSRDAKYIEDVKKALRNEIFNGKRSEFYYQNTKSNNFNIRIANCVNCNIETDKIAVDHYPMSYCEILDKFLKGSHINLKTLDIQENENNELHLSNKDLGEEWSAFHDEIATFRFLCNHCNSKFGSYGYTSKCK